MATKRIKESEVYDLVERIANGQFFNIKFYKKDGTLRSAVAQKGVYNPSNHPAPKGTGESGKQALKNGRIKFYECHHKNDDGSVTGEYRQASIERLVSITCNGDTYEVNHQE